MGQLSELLAERTQDYTGAEISLVCREAVVMALEENLECESIGLPELERSLKKVKKRLTPFDIAKFEQFGKQLRE